jgi:hypothetical protein
MENKQDLILNNCINEEKNIRLESISNLSKEIVDENLIKIEVE